MFIVFIKSLTSLFLQMKFTKSSSSHRRPPTTAPTPADPSFLRRPPRFSGDPQFCNPICHLV
ncbi:hypothetical protein HanRHA438_Chr06g0266611 [Helianthus annuus]|nr:hypothetical protein HanRHA438_Chr06g0266611 [Helianthus annuus]